MRSEGKEGGAVKVQNRVRLCKKHFFSLILCIAIMLVFCVVMNGRLGLYFASALVLALLLSFFMTWFTVRQVEISFVSRNEMINKGDEVEISFAVSKRTWLPTPFIEICLNAEDNLEPVTPERFRVAMGFTKRRRSYSVKYKARYCGSGSVGLKMPVIIDYLGVFTTQVGRLEISGDGVCRFGIIPMIHEIESGNELLKICCDAAAYDDNTEETDESAPIGTGTAGYEHREYVAGDPIKRINWKLSSKRDTLMIRLDEKTAAVSQAMIFELSDERRGEQGFCRCCDILTEATLAMAALMLKQGLSCEVFCQNGERRSFGIDSEADLAEYQSSLASCSPSSGGESLPLEELEAGKHRVVIYFTNRKDTLAQRVAQLSDGGCEVYTVVVHDYADGLSVDRCYYVSDDFVFTSNK